MRSTLSLSVVVARAPRELAAFLCDLRNTQALHPLLRGLSLEREDGATRVWRCDDRIFGFPLTYFAHQVVDADGLGYTNTTRQRGLTLTNAWRVHEDPRGALVTEHVVFEGAAPIVWLSKHIGGRAHRALFAALRREYGAR